MKDLWERVAEGDALFGEGTTIDSALGEDGAYLRFAASLPPERAKRKNMRNEDWLGKRPAAGTRVAFADTLEAILTYPDFPSPGIGSTKAEGSIIAVRTSSGDTTSRGGRVYVQWDDGKVRAVAHEHLRPASGRLRMANSFRRKVAGLGDLTDFLRSSETDLVHKSTKDLWSLRKEGEQYVIERMFDASGDPLKGV